MLASRTRDSDAVVTVSPAASGALREGACPVRTLARSRSGSPCRRLAAAGLLAALAALTAAAWRRTGAERSVPRTPSRLALDVAAPNGTRLHIPAAGSPPTVLLYVSPDCPHCHAELSNWGEVAGRHPGLLATVDVVVVSPPRAAEASWVPVNFPHRYFRDGGREIARTLGVRAVPFCVWADSSGSVRRVTIGETGTDQIVGNLRLITGVGT